MPDIDPDVLDSIQVNVAAGVYSRELIVRILCEELYAPGELDPVQVTAATDAALAQLREQQADWPAVTDCDRIDRAFAALNEAGIIALQNAGFTQSDGYHDVRERYAAHPEREVVRGYCFYHWQDLEGAVRGRGLYLAFGPIDPNTEHSEGPKIGSLVQQACENQGLEVAWDGSFGSRIKLPNFNWQRRIP